jgi:uncharacterized protein YggE
MKKILVLIFVLFYNLHGLDISKQKTFTTSISPTIQATSFSLNHIAKTSSEIEKIFNKAIRIATKSKICSGGQYRIYPDYKYVENRKIENGYNSNLYFQCEFSDNGEYEEILTKIKKLNVKLTQNKISYKITEKQTENEKSKLEFLAFDYAKLYTQKLTNIFNNCKIKSISFNQYNTPIQYKTLSREESTTVSSPIQEDIEISLKVDYLFDCKN